MKLLRLALFALAGCGARTGLDVEAPTATDASAPTGAPWIVFDLFGAGEPARLYAIRADGTDARDLGRAANSCLYPTFSPDGATLLCVAYAPGSETATSIVAHDLRRRTQRTVISGASFSALAVSPDQRSIAYTAGLDVRAVRWDGTGDRRLVQGPFEAGCCQWGYGHPAFAADPETVLFATAGRIERIGLDGARRQLLVTENFVRIIFPNVAISPDRTRVAAGVACATGGRTLRSWPLAALPAPCESGSVLTEIEISSVGNQSNNPAWGASGQIVFQQRNDLYLVDSAGGAARNLTEGLTGGDGGNVSAAYPAWAPAGFVPP
jgi:hypothetical protein